MTRFLVIAIITLLLVASPAAQASVMYDFSYTFEQGTVVTGSFMGDANGNLISNLSNISVSVNGNPLNGSGNLLNFFLDVSGWGQWIADSGLVSFDGTQNNFLFSDGDINVSNGTNWFQSSIFTHPTSGQQGVGAEIYVKGKMDLFDLPAFGAWQYVYDPSRWSVREHTSSVPEPATMFIFGVGIAGIGIVGRKFNK